MIEIIDLRYSKDSEFLKELKERATVDFRDYERIVQNILAGVKEEGDRALLKYTEKFDGVDLSDMGMKVTNTEIKEAYDEVSEDFLNAIRLAIKNITDYHKKQLRNSWFTSSDGIMLGQKVTPIAGVGIYVPGGTAAYPSSVLMNAIPAEVAGVKRIVMVTPPNGEGKLSAGVLVAARELNIDEIYKVGGAQSIGALAYGTETIERVSKIVGPGNIYVATAKREVYGYVDIDMIAGPSEILVVADDFADAEYVAADLLSQAEHDELSSAIAITTNEELGRAIVEEVGRQIGTLERKDIIEKSLANYGKVILVENLEEAIELSNEIAPEHLELCVR
ncbi:MAG TPA: histidinol dehydrogenase, partial [Clostridia bacterium]|nr:histidinol dehydrogenase [Clostridia bacterium]